MRKEIPSQEEIKAIKEGQRRYQREEFCTKVAMVLFFALFFGVLVLNQCNESDDVVLCRANIEALPNCADILSDRYDRGGRVD